jgi:hypothetical protein
MTVAISLDVACPASGPLVAEAACFFDAAYLDLVKGLLHLDAAGIEPPPESAKTIEAVGAMANRVTALADALGHAEVAAHFQRGSS